MSATASQLLQGRSMERWREQFDEQGYLVFEQVLSESLLDGVRAGLQPWLQQDLPGRNNFEGHSSNRIYALLDKSPVFSELVMIF